MCWTLMGGYEKGNLLTHINALGFETLEDLAEVSDEWILEHWRMG